MARVCWWVEVGDNRECRGFRITDDFIGTSGRKLFVFTAYTVIASYCRFTDTLTCNADSHAVRRVSRAGQVRSRLLRLMILQRLGQAAVIMHQESHFGTKPHVQHRQKELIPQSGLCGQGGHNLIRSRTFFFEKRAEEKINYAISLQRLQLLFGPPCPQSPLWCFNSFVWHLINNA